MKKWSLSEICEYINLYNPIVILLRIPIDLFKSKKITHHHNLILNFKHEYSHAI